MLYREAGDFKTSYEEDSQTFPIAFDRYRYWAVLAFAFLVVPFFINDYWANALVVPFLIYAIAAIGLNILTGLLRAGQPWYGRFHGCGGLCLLQADDRLFPMSASSFTSFWQAALRRRSARPLACPPCGSRGFIWRLPHWPRSSFLSGSSTRSAGSTTTRPQARSTRRNAPSLVCLSPAPIQKPGRNT